MPTEGGLDAQGAGCPHLGVHTISNGPGEMELGREIDQGKLRDSLENSPCRGEQAEVLGWGRRGRGHMLTLRPGFQHQM